MPSKPLPPWPSVGARRDALAALLRDYDLLPNTLLAGRDSIVAYLAALGVRDYAGRRPTWTQVYRAARRYGFPLVPGTRAGRNYFAALTSPRLILAWLVSRENAAGLGPWRVFIAKAAEARKQPNTGSRKPFRNGRGVPIAADAHAEPAGDAVGGEGTP